MDCFCRGCFWDLSNYATESWTEEETTKMNRMKQNTPPGRFLTKGTTLWHVQGQNISLYFLDNSWKYNLGEDGKKVLERFYILQALPLSWCRLYRWAPWSLQSFWFKNMISRLNKNPSTPVFAHKRRNAEPRCCKINISWIKCGIEED